MFKAHYNGLLRSQSCIWQTAQAAEAPCEASHRPIHHTSGVKLTPQCELHTAAARHSFAPEAYTQFAQQVFEQRPHLPRMYKWLHSRSGIISLNIFLYFGPPRAPKAQWNPEEALQNIRFGRHKWQLHLHACLPLQPPTSVIPEWIKKKKVHKTKTTTKIEPTVRNLFSWKGSLWQQCLWQKGVLCPCTLTWLAVYLCQHIFNGVLIVPQGLGVRRGVAMASTPLHHVLCLQGCDAVKPGVLLYDFLQDLSHGHCSLPLWQTKGKTCHTSRNIYGWIMT